MMMMLMMKMTMKDFFQRPGMDKRGSETDSLTKQKEAKLRRMSSLRGNSKHSIYSKNPRLRTGIFQG